MPKREDEAGKIVGIIVLVVVVIVAVTVVLAAVLYVMVIGFGGEGYSIPAGSWDTESLSNTSGKITFGMFSEEVTPSDIQIYIQADGQNIGYLTFRSDTASSPAEMYWTEGPAGVSAQYVDYNPSGGIINGGDNIVLYGLEPETEYSFEVYHIPSDSIINMVGNEHFITDP